MDREIKTTTNIISSLPPVGWVMSYICYLFSFAHSGVQHMLSFRGGGGGHLRLASVSRFTIVIAPSVFSNVYL